MLEYHRLLDHTIRQGSDRPDPAGRVTLSVFGRQEQFDLTEGRLPFLTTNSIPFRWIAEELFWMLSGDTSAYTLISKGVRLRESRGASQAPPGGCYADGLLGPVAGYNWRSYGGSYPDFDGTDQLAALLAEIERNPSSRRLLLVGWDPATSHSTPSPTCHTVAQFEVAAAGLLNCLVFFRSFDLYHYAYAITTYGLLTHLVAHTARLTAGRLTTAFGDLHVYRDDLLSIREVLSREPLAQPRLEILDPDARLLGLPGLLALRYEHLRLHRLQSHPHAQTGSA